MSEKENPNHLNMIKKVRQHNDFVESPYATELSLHEIKLIEFLISECKEEDHKLIGKMQSKDFVFSAVQLAKLLNTSLSRVVADADKLASAITKKNIIHKSLDKNGELEDFNYLAIIIEANYSKGTFRFGLNYKALPFFVNVNKNFTEFQLRHLLSMSSPYAVKLYKILYQYKNIGKRKFSVNELKAQFGISKEKYKQFGHFKSRVLNISIDQINKHTDVFVSCDEIKFGKSIQELEFIISPKKKNLNEIKESSPSYPINSSQKEEKLLLPEDILQTINENKEKITSKTLKLINEYYESKGDIFIKCSLDYALKNSKTNFDKYLQDTLNNNWAEGLFQETEVLIKKQKQLKQREIKESEQNNKEREKRRLLALEKYNLLTSTEKDKILDELLAKVSKQKPELLPEIFKSKEDYLISYWAMKNGEVYNGQIQFQLTACTK